MKYTMEQITQIAMARDDIEFFAENFIKIVSGNSIIDIQFTDFQRDVIHHFNTERNFFLPSDRQTGKTTVAAIILLHQAIFHECRVSLIFAYKQESSNRVLRLVAEMYDLLPEFMKIVKITTRNKTKLEFENLCSIVSCGSSCGYAKGRAVSLMYFDESEFIAEIREIMHHLIPTMVAIPYAKIFSLSTTRTQDLLRELTYV
jgi:hypothetical protein